MDSSRSGHLEVGANLLSLTELCGRANCAHRARKFARAVKCYSMALAQCEAMGLPSESRAVIFSNRACANIQRPGEAAFAEALRDAERAKRAARSTERAQYDLALMMVRNKDVRLKPNFQWYPKQVLGNRAQDDPVAKRLTLPAPHTARHATLRPTTALPPRLVLTDRPSQNTRRKKKGAEIPYSPPYHQKDYQVSTPDAGRDTSLQDRESRKEAYAQALDEVNAEGAAREAVRAQEALARAENRKKRDVTLTLEGIGSDGDPLLRSVTPELDVLTPAVVREGLAKQRSKQIYKDMKQEQQHATVASLDATEDAECASVASRDTLHCAPSDEIPSEICET